jgi:hypothetical protein
MRHEELVGKWIKPRIQQFLGRRNVDLRILDAEMVAVNGQRSGREQQKAQDRKIPASFRVRCAFPLCRPQSRQDSLLFRHARDSMPREIKEDHGMRPAKIRLNTASAQDTGLTAFGATITASLSAHSILETSAPATADE